MSDRWWRDAACQGVPVETFYPGTGTTQVAALRVIDRWCVPCPVRAACLAHEAAQPVTQQWGIRGGVWRKAGGGGMSTNRRGVYDPHGYLPDDGGAS